MKINNLKKLVKETIAEVLGENKTYTVSMTQPLIIKGTDINHPHDIIIGLDTQNQNLAKVKANVSVQKSSFDAISIKLDLI